MITLTDKMIDFIYFVQRSTDFNLKAVHMAKCPHWHDLKALRRPVYKYDGKDVFVDNASIFILYNTPFLSNNNHNPMWIQTMEDAVKKFLIMPFILFYQNKDTDKCIPIPWDKIYVIRNYNYTYIVLDGADQFANVEYLRAIVSPRKMTYRRYADVYPEKGFVFDATGKYVFNKALINTIKQNYTIHVNDIDIIMDRTFAIGAKGFTIPRSRQGEKIFLENIFVFYDDFIVADTGKYIEHIEGNAFRFKKDVDPTRVRIGYLYYTPSNLSLDNIRIKIDKNTMDNEALKDVKDSASSKYIAMKDPLDLTDDPTLLDKWYAILGYNKDLYPWYTGDDVPEDDDINPYPNKSVVYTGKEIKDMDEDGIVKIPNLRWNETYDNSDVINSGYCKALIFQNGSLISAVTTTTQTTVSFAISELSDIQDDDIFEVEYLSFNDEGKMIAYNSTILNNFSVSEEELSHAKLHANNIQAFMNPPIPSMEFNIDTNLLEYMILMQNNPYTSELDGKLYCNISANEKNYRETGLDVKFVAKNRYAHNRFIITEDEQISFNLSEDFRYCQDLNSYLFMINGKIINHKYLRLSLPKSTNAFTKVNIYSRVSAKQGDYVDVFYLPSEMKEVFTLKEFDNCGVYTIPEDELSKLPAKLSTSCYWFFLNGKKVCGNDISFPSNDTIAINNPGMTAQNLTIIFIKNLIKPYKESEVVSDNDEYSSLSDMEIASSLGVSPLHGNDQDIYDELYDLDTIVKVIISEFYNDINNAEPMTYEEVIKEIEIDTMTALSTRLGEDSDNLYGAYKSGSYNSDKDKDTHFRSPSL